MFHLIQIVGVDHGNCPTDYLEIFDGPSVTTSPSMGRFCGSGHIHEIITTGDQMTVRFVSDSSGSDLGFNLEIDYCMRPVEAPLYIIIQQD